MPKNRIQFQSGYSLPELFKDFGTERQCTQALFNWKWPDGFICPECGSKSFCTLKSRKVYQSNHCHHQTSLTSGTIFASTELPLTTWFLAIHLLTQLKTGMSALELKRQINVSYNTAWGMKQKNYNYRLGNKVVPMDDPDDFKIIQSSEWGASKALSELAKQIGLPQLLYSRPQPWIKSAMAMIVGRLVYPGSKLSLCKQHKNTGLSEIAGIEGDPDVDEHCYRVMDQLLKRQKSIQKKLAKKHLNSHHMPPMLGMLAYFALFSEWFARK
jgi:hypothetical protein